MVLPEFHVGSLDELRTVEREAAARLNQEPTIARLFLNAPVQALAAVGIALSLHTIDEWTQLVGSLPASLRTISPFGANRPSSMLPSSSTGFFPPGPRVLTSPSPKRSADRGVNWLRRSQSRENRMSVLAGFDAVIELGVGVNADKLRRVSFGGSSSIPPRRSLSATPSTAPTY